VSHSVSTQDTTAYEDTRTVSRHPRIPQALPTWTVVLYMLVLTGAAILAYLSIITSITTSRSTPTAERRLREPTPEIVRRLREPTHTP
jgi:hypothetical protein